MEWISVIVSSIATLVGLVGGGVGIFFWQENKALKQAEVKDQLVDVELKEADEWHKLYNEQKEKCDAKSAENRELYNEIAQLKEDKSKLKFKIQQLNWYKCCDNACDKRQPPRDFNELKSFDEIE
jgi:hypothetical protein